MRLIFRQDAPDEVPWVVDRFDTEPDIAGALVVTVPSDFEPIAEEIETEEGRTVRYKTLAQVRAETA